MDLPLTDTTEAGAAQSPATGIASQPSGAVDPPLADPVDATVIPVQLAATAAPLLEPSPVLLSSLGLLSTTAASVHSPAPVSEVSIAGSPSSQLLSDPVQPGQLVAGGLDLSTLIQQASDPGRSLSSSASPGESLLSSSSSPSCASPPVQVRASPFSAMHLATATATHLTQPLPSLASPVQLLSSPLDPSPHPSLHHPPTSHPHAQPPSHVSQPSLLHPPHPHSAVPHPGQAYYATSSQQQLLDAAAVTAVFQQHQNQAAANVVAAVDALVQAQAMIAVDAAQVDAMMNARLQQRADVAHAQAQVGAIMNAALQQHTNAALANAADVLALGSADSMPAQVSVQHLVGQAGGSVTSPGTGLSSQSSIMDAMINANRAQQQQQQRSVALHQCVQAAFRQTHTSAAHHPVPMMTAVHSNFIDPMITATAPMDSASSGVNLASLGFVSPACMDFSTASAVSPQAPSSYPTLYSEPASLMVAAESGIVPSSDSSDSMLSSTLLSYPSAVESNTVAQYETARINSAETETEPSEESQKDSADVATVQKEILITLEETQVKIATALESISAALAPSATAEVPDHIQSEESGDQTAILEDVHKVQKMVEKQTDLIEHILAPDEYPNPASDSNRSRKGDFDDGCLASDTDDVYDDEYEDADGSHVIESSANSNLYPIRTLAKLSKTELIKTVLDYQDQLKELQSSEMSSRRSSVAYQNDWKCQWQGCDVMCTTPEELTEHMTEYHVEPSQGGFVCRWENCRRHRKPFPKRARLLNHFKTHSGERPFLCPYEGCNKRFTRSDALKTHMLIHDNKKPHICTEDGCTAAFYHRRSFVKHMAEVHRIRANPPANPHMTEELSSMSVSKRRRLTSMGDSSGYEGLFVAVKREPSSTVSDDYPAMQHPAESTGAHTAMLDAMANGFSDILLHSTMNGTTPYPVTQDACHAPGLPTYYPNPTGTARAALVGAHMNVRLPFAFIVAVIIFMTVVLLTAFKWNRQGWLPPFGT